MIGPTHLDFLEQRTDEVIKMLETLLSHYHMIPSGIRYVIPLLPLENILTDLKLLRSEIKIKECRLTNIGGKDEYTDSLRKVGQGPGGI